MTDILVSGLINIETTLKIDAFPLPYFPVSYAFNAVSTTVSGVGYNVARALSTLGSLVRLVSILGRDESGEFARHMLKANGISPYAVIDGMERTACSVILYDGDGKREIHVDLKDIQEQAYPPELFEQAAAKSNILALCNINFSRPFLEKARRAGKVVATDVHVISDLDDAYNRDFMAAAHILFMSDAGLPCPPREWAARVLNRFGTEIVVIGMGGEGVLLAVRKDKTIEYIPAVRTRPVVNTIGAGDALFSAFLHFYDKTADPYLSIKKAAVFASYKVGESGGASGFLTEAQVDALYAEVAAK